MLEKLLAECNYSGKQVVPGFPHTLSLLSSAPVCSGSSRSVSNTIFPAYVTLYKRRNYQTSSRTSPRECSLRALIRAGSKFCFHSGWEYFFQLKSTCPMDQTGCGSIQSFPFFMDTTRKTKERRDQKKEKTHRETRINKFNHVKGPEEGRGWDLFTQNQDSIPSARNGGHRWGSGTIKSILLLCVLKTSHLHGWNFQAGTLWSADLSLPHPKPWQITSTTHFYPVFRHWAPVGNNTRSFRRFRLAQGRVGRWEIHIQIFHKYKNAALAAWHCALITRISIIWGITFLSQLSLCCFSWAEQRSENSWNRFWPQPLICFPQGRSGRLYLQKPQTGTCPEPEMMNLNWRQAQGYSWPQRNYKEISVNPG